MSVSQMPAAEPLWMRDLAPGISADAEDLNRLERQSRRGETTRVIPPPFDELSDEAARLVLSRWNAPCEGAFEALAASFPVDLARWIDSGRLAIPDLTFAAESLGRSDLGWLVRRTLKPLLDHDSAVVREGAIYGIQRHLDVEARTKLESVAKLDPSSAVRSAAEDAISEP